MKRSMIKMGIRNAGETIYPGGARDISTEQVREARGFGRWIYCKYCYKNVRPAVSVPNEKTRKELFETVQIICDECGYALTPFFRTEDQLHRWIAGEEVEFD